MEHRARRQLVWRWLAVAVLAWVVGALLAQAAYAPRVGPGSWPAGLVPGGLLAQAAYGRLSGEASVFLGGLVSGAVLGVLQWLVMRPHRIGVWWVVVTTAVLGLLSYGAARVWPGGLVVTYVPLWGPYMGPPAASTYLSFGMASVIAGGLFGGITGLLLGTGQWLVFRLARPASGRWIVANVVGLSAGFAASAAVLSCLTLMWGPNQSRVATLLVVLAHGSVRGVASGAITARTLLPLLQI